MRTTPAHIILRGAFAVVTEETISMKLTWHGHSAFRIEAGAAKILIDPFLSDHPSWRKGWIGSRAGEDSTRGGGR
jgi:L-ascorbate metabolism protein UlaG (beta-lactamase superfamily)